MQRAISLFCLVWGQLAAFPFPHTPQEVVDQIYDMLEVIDREFEREGIPYVISAGTLLGAVRQKGFIPWDDDADFFVLQRDVPKVLRLKQRLKCLGYGLSNNQFNYQIYPLERRIFKQGPFVDLFPVREISGVYTYNSSLAREMWKDWMTLHEWQERTKIPFGHLMLFAPPSIAASRMLNSLYGPNWSKEATRIYDHNEGKLIDSEVIEVEVFAPALHSRYLSPSPESSSLSTRALGDPP
ncbi:MAG: LicD family protein [Chlamydiia bacterium]|nr:LicD family protein [Chlamydiia bacterium]